jgi:5-methylcytosine-specific restriction endonuclease McrA
MPRALREQACQRCGARFKSRQPNQKYCGYVCARLEYKRQSIRTAKTIPRICGLCGNHFLVSPLQEAKGHGRFCSRKCLVAFIHRVRMPTARCARCGNEFNRRPGATANKYCSRECQLLGRWDGRRSLTKTRDGERQIIRERIKEIGKCEECGSTDELHGHHKISKAERPDLRKDPNNIQILCAQCHAKKHLPRLALFILKATKSRDYVTKRLMLSGTP